MIYSTQMSDRSIPSDPARDPLRHADHVRAIVASKRAAATSPLAASWVRSLTTFGLDPEKTRSTDRLEDRKLREHREAAGDMLNISQPVMDRLFSSIGLAGCSVFLTDSDGVVLDQRTPASEDKVFERAGLCEGAVWSESVQGTNGIGTCISEARSVLIYRDEHFRVGNTQMSCMGAPIFDAYGRLAAVLDVSSCREDVNRPLAKLIHQSVCDAARQIEADNFHSTFASKRILRHPSDGQKGAVLFAIDQDDLVVGATRGARQAYGLTDESFQAPRPAGDLFGDNEARGVGLESAERRELRRALARSNGNMTATAKRLGISRATLYRRLEKHGLTD